MNAMARKLKPTPIDGDDEVDALAGRIRELDARRSAVTELILNMEKTNAGQREDISSGTAQAEALLSGAKFELRRELPVTELIALHSERDTIDRALKIGRARHHLLSSQRAVKIWASFSDQIAAIEKRRVLLALELQETNRSRERLRETIAAAGGAGFFSTDGVPLLDLGGNDDEVKWARERVVADGIATRTEIERASHGDA